jgi:hypothetical protein
MTLIELDRQVRLVEVAPAGQARIEREEYVVAEHPGAEVEVLYLHRAGAQRLRWSSRCAPMAFPHAAAFASPEARAFAAGAWGALKQLRRALGVGVGAPPC